MYIILEQLQIIDNNTDMVTTFIMCYQLLRSFLTGWSELASFGNPTALPIQPALRHPRPRGFVTAATALLIMAIGVPALATAVTSLQQATAVIHIVFLLVVVPVEGLLLRRAHPAGTPSGGHVQ